MLRLLFLALAVSITGACGEKTTDSAIAAEPVQTLLTGTVIYRERMPLRLNAVINVRLQDISLQDAPAMLLAEQKIPAKGQAVPIPFELAYDPTKIDQGYTYAVRAEIRDGQGMLLWTTTTVYPVLTGGAPSDKVEIMLERVAD